MRRAAREDFFVIDKTLSPHANIAIKDPRSTLMSSWQMSSNLYNNLDGTFRDFGIDLSGRELIDTLTDFCSTENTFGSWIDICGVKGKYVPHRFVFFCSLYPCTLYRRYYVRLKLILLQFSIMSYASWHQDSGLDQVTVMVGFPPCDDYVGIGVFSHIFKLSHRFPPPALAKPRLLVCSENSYSCECMPSRIEDRYIVRPLYREGKEVMVYNDQDVYHSAPDRINRESVWRFM